MLRFKHPIVQSYPTLVPYIPPSRRRNFISVARPQATVMAALELSGGQKVPVLGLGVWRTSPGVLDDVILEALRQGYRHFDCAGSLQCYPGPHAMPPFPNCTTP